MFEDIKWDPVDCGWVKENFDADSKGNLIPSRASCIIRDNDINTLAIRAKRLQEGTNNEVEVQDVLFAIQMVKNFVARKLHLEGDSLIIVMVIMNDTS